MSAQPHILLIDDDRAWLETLSEFLTENGLAVETAVTGDQGLVALEKPDIVLALIDYHLDGERNGLDLLQELRRRRHDLTTILVSAEEELSLPAQALASGARAFVPKTSSPRFILRTVRQALAESDSLRAAPSPGRWLPGPSWWGRIFPLVPSSGKSWPY
ncbi:MAG: response regulator [Planctomycetes bacterium]|nr:response regulator [Planctomycetota bacterium]